MFLNLGTFGSCPLAVLEYQNELRKELKSNLSVQHVFFSKTGYTPTIQLVFRAFLVAP